MNKNLPKIIFYHSWVYDRTIQRLSSKKSPKIFSDSYFIKHINKLSKEWKKVEFKILKELSKITKLRWHEKDIKVYITVGMIPFSSPLTLNLKSDIHTLTHEFIHRILSQLENWPRIEKNWNHLMDKYKKEIPKAGGNLRGHIIVHAIHQHILEKFFDKKTLQKVVDTVKHPDYLRSWEIVKRDGYKEIIRELTKGF